jgi:hypothetical protein
LSTNDWRGRFSILDNEAAFDGWALNFPNMDGDEGQVGYGDGNRDGLGLGGDKMKVGRAEHSTLSQKRMYQIPSQQLVFCCNTNNI